MTGATTQRIALDLPAAEALERAFRRDLRWLAETLGCEVVKAEPVSPLRRRGHPRAAFRVTLADGRVVKLRRVGEVEEAAELERLLVRLAPVGLPRVLARRRRSLVLEWLDGTPLSSLPDARVPVAAAAELLGCIHAMPPGGSPPAQELARAEGVRAGQQLAQLVAAGALAHTEADDLDQALAQRLPARPDAGIVQGDFAPENLLLDATGRVRVIDNEGVRVGVLDLDLARSWSRWPMADSRWQAFLEAYAAAAGRRVRDEDLTGWKLRTLVVTAWYRTAFRVEGAGRALQGLRDFRAALT